MYDNWAEIFSHYWWLLFPIFGFIYAAFGTSLHYRDRRDRLELLKTYVQQGKEPPPELAKALQNGNGHDDWGFGSYRREGRYSEWRYTVLFAALAAGFGIVYYMRPATEAFAFVAIIMGVLAVAYLIYSLFLPKSDGK